MNCIDRWRRRRRRRRNPCLTHSCSWKWSICSRSCGGGTQRPIVTRPKGRCGRCHLPSSRWCNTRCCPVSCRWGSWGSWSSCSVTCGSGLSWRTRSHAVSQHCGGSYCSGSTRGSKSCYAGCCPVNCQWGRWGSWNSCSTTCGSGISTRTRGYGVNRKCGGSSCSGSNRETKSCNTASCCAVNCQWANWGPFGSCSVTCGRGEKTRNRYIGVQPRCGGESCPGPFTQTLSCNSQCCPIDCQWSSWSLYGPCSTTCGIGVKSRIREITVASFCNGEACVGGEIDIALCFVDLTCRPDEQGIETDLIEGTDIIDLNSTEPRVKLYPKTMEGYDELSGRLKLPGNAASTGTCYVV